MSKNKRRLWQKKSTEYKSVQVLLKSDGNQEMLMPGRHCGWSLKNVPMSYLEWMLRDVSALEYRDVAEIEIFRRRKNPPVFASPPQIKRKSSSASVALSVPAYIQPKIPKSDGSCPF